jgi:hypothetical protein
MNDEIREGDGLFNQQTLLSNFGTKALACL